MEKAEWKYIPRKTGVATVLGEAGQDPQIQEMARLLQERNQDAANTLFEWLLIDGAKDCIQVEDIENLASIGKSPEFMRKIIVELMLSLRKKQNPDL